jgi:hypothetical protein
LKRIMYEILGGIPFLLTTDAGMKINYARIIEAIIIAGIGGFLAAQLTVNELKIKMSYQEGQLTSMETKIAETCKILIQNQTEIVRIDTLQKERIERERKQGFK